MIVNKIARLPFYFFYTGFSRLALGLQSLFVRLSPKPDRFRALNFFKDGAKLRAKKWEGKQEYPVYVINRKCDGERLSRFSNSCAKWGVEFERVEAINCADSNFDFRPYDAKIAETFYGKKEFLRGAVGCFLSHAKAWQKLVDSEFSHALICEDDVRWLGPIPKNIIDFKAPRDFDVIFVHRRLAAALQSGGQTKSGELFGYCGVAEAGISILEEFQQMSASGGEGYLLSREGAKIILEIFQRRGVFMEVDWFLFFQSMTLQQRKNFIQVDSTGRFDMLEFDACQLDSAVLLPSLLEQLCLKSTIAFENPQNYISRASMVALPEKR
jgi:GR25 family glycosyltransferase involved in LPS biosynthesis